VEPEEPQEKDCMVRNMSFQFRASQKVGVIGQVGSGKTSLLLAMLGEMPIEEGTVLTKQNASIVYAE
jgi:ABC-type cobalamin/Fe3+-siderophores transport system ATPase subunit